MLIFAFVSVTGSGVPWGPEESQNRFRYMLDGLRRRTLNWDEVSSGRRMSKQSRAASGREYVCICACHGRAGIRNCKVTQTVCE